jgi:2-polyprenyl-3-methyl-5-hydroxy-6-metoxy-1,4-benzoquinol methylase
MFKFLNQTNFPFLWQIFQLLIGGTIDKRKLCKLKYNNQKTVLEVGCSIGNIAGAFICEEGIDYLGIDIDPVVIEYARQNFIKHQNFNFECIDLKKLADQGKKFEYVMFAGICHHIDDDLLTNMLNYATKLLNKDSKLVIIEPLIPEKQDSRFFSIFLKLEKGKFLRTNDNLCHILTKIKNLNLIESQMHYVGATPLSWPKCARFGIYTLTRSIA